MKNRNIPFTKLPIFSKYIYTYIKENGEYDLSQEFINQNFCVIGYCRCGKSDCSTIYLKSKMSLKKYKVDHPCTLKIDGIIDHLHINSKEKPTEYEYLSLGMECYSIYDDEVKTAVDTEYNKKKIILKQKKYKNRVIIKR